MSLLDRRDFLKHTSLAATAGLARAKAGSVAIVLPPNDPVASSAAARWAAGELEQALTARGVSARIVERTGQAAAGDFVIQAAGAKVAGGAPEALSLTPARSGLAASANDPRGLMYALVELADRARDVPDALASLAVRNTIVEKPANAIRSIARCFESDLEDKSWFYDRDMWRAYLSMLATGRFNRFNLTFGLGYNFPRNVSDVYFYFAYPFLLSVPGYGVRARGLPDSERDRNLEMLSFISEETVKRGLQFQLALWTHAYEWVDSPKANYVIEGLTPSNHPAYCRDALHALLEAVPAISGVTFRIHGESGIPEGSYDFWKTVFEGIVRTGRRIEIDMHAKGMDQQMIDVALATGMPVNVSPKYWAEHMGLPYHQAAIRELEMPPERKVEGVFALSSGSRRFLRYGYGDLLKENRRYGVLHRIWPGTQRVLLWGDPALAAGYGRLASFCGSAGVELCEPLTFKGRMGSGVSGGRCSYADASLNPRYDWEKYLHTYRVFGRLIYNPDTDPEVWRRHLRKSFDAGAAAAETALASASRVLPLMTTTHGASGSNNSYWPEIYTNMSIVDPASKHPYRDSPSPLRFGAVSPFDPQLFARVDDFAEELLKGTAGGKYSPLVVSEWLEQLSQTAAKSLEEAQAQTAAKATPEFRRLAADVAIQSGIGRFFAHKLRAGVLWAIYDRTGEAKALEEALKAYRAAHRAWSGMANRARDVYARDITYGTTPHMRGHWIDRLPAIEEDIARMEKSRPSQAGQHDAERVRGAIQMALSPPKPIAVACRHTPPARFRPGAPLEIQLSLERGNGRQVRLHYRRVNQAERWQSIEMQWRDNRYAAVIPGPYTQSPYPLQYYFNLRHSADQIQIYPGLEATLSNQPYFVVRQA